MSFAAAARAGETTIGGGGEIERATATAATGDDVMIVTRPGDDSAFGGRRRRRRQSARANEWGRGANRAPRRRLRRRGWTGRLQNHRHLQEGEAARVVKARPDPRRVADKEFWLAASSAEASPGEASPGVVHHHGASVSVATEITRRTGTVCWREQRALRDAKFLWRNRILIITCNLFTRSFLVQLYCS